jgi:chemotaxis protein MotC
LVIKKEPARAIELFEQARLLSPGTLIEEAALRRQIALLASRANFEKFEATSAIYMRRFPQSVYAGAFKAQLVEQIVSHDTAMHKLESMLAGLNRLDRRELYLAIAKAGTARGKVELVRFAAPRAATLADSNSLEGSRCKLYEAAVLVVTDEFDRGAAQLQALSRAALPGDDGDLLDAARAVAMEVKRTPVQDETAQLTPAGDQPALKSVVAAQQAIVAVDALLKGAEK